MDDCLRRVDTARDIRRDQSCRAGASPGVGTCNHTRSAVRRRRLVLLRVSHAGCVRGFKAMAVNARTSLAACRASSLIRYLVLCGMGDVWRDLSVLLMRIFAPDLFRTAMQGGAAQFWRQIGVEWLSWIFITLPFGVAVYLCVVGIEHAHRYFVEAREREVQVAKLQSNFQARASPRYRHNSIRTFSSIHSTRSRYSFVTTTNEVLSVLSNI